MSMTGKHAKAATVGIALLLASQFVLAAGSSGQRYINNLKHPNAEKVYVVSDGDDWGNPDACDRSNQLVLSKGKLKNEQIYRELLAMVLSAHLSDRQVAARVDGCVLVSGKSYPAIVQLTLY